MRGLELIMWPEGQWEASKKNAPDGVQPRTDGRTWRLYDWIGPVGPIQWKSINKNNKKLQQISKNLTTKILKKSFFLLPDDFFCYFVSFAIYGWLLLSRPFQRRLIAEDCPSLITATLYLRKSMSSTNWYIIGHPYTTLHYTTLNYITLNYTTLQYTAPHLTLLHYITLHCTTFN